MKALCNRVIRFGKIELMIVLGLLSLTLSACSTNPATGQRQFTGLMSEAEENRVGYEQHPKILAQFGGEYEHPKLQTYVRELGDRVSKGTERPDVKYQFFLLDSPVINAFAVPGGYIYATRGLLAAANSEAELAGVLAHEVGHITGRHSAERYSRGVLTQIGATVASAAIGSQAASQAIGLGTGLVTSSYSREQEREADDLGVRYLHRSGYDTQAMAGFLSQLEADHKLQSKISGKKQSMPSFFSTHPNTAERVATTKGLAKQYPPNDRYQGRDRHLNMINGMIYGDSHKQGFARGQTFYHPELNFTYTVPKGYKIVNQPSQVLAVSEQGSAVILDMRTNKGKQGPVAYVQHEWLKDEKIDAPEEITINGMRAATTSFNGKLNGKAVVIRVVAIEYSPDKMYRFQLAYPPNSSKALIEDLKKTTYSFRRMSAAEKRSIKPQTIRVITARSGDTVQSLANRMSFDNLKVERFMALNGLRTGEKIIPGRKYKVVVGG